MIIIKYILIAIGAVIAFIVWRVASVTRGIRQRDEKLARELERLARELDEKAGTAQQTAQELAGKPQLRYMLYALLKKFGRSELFPREYLGEEAQGEAKLAQWMMHPNELQDAPKEIELLEMVSRSIQGEECAFYVYRYRMAQGHWAGEDWLLGLCGPFGKSDPPYEGRAGAFSRVGDKQGTISTTDLVDWFIGAAEGKRSKAA
jgi:hypothetical protein